MPIYKGPPPRVSALPCADLPSATPMAELRPSEIDISDLGSRSYAARTDFYCLVTDEDV